MDKTYVGTYKQGERLMDALSLGVAFHTAFRKAADSEASSKIWWLIDRMPEEEYASIIDFVYQCMWKPGRVRKTDRT